MADHIYFFVFAIFPLSFDKLTVGKSHLSPSMHLVIVKLSNILFLIVPGKFTHSAHLIFFNRSFIHPVLCFHRCVLAIFIVFYEITIVSAFFGFEGSFTPHVTLPELALVYATIIACVNSYSLFNSLMKLSFIF